MASSTSAGITGRESKSLASNSRCEYACSLPGFLHYAQMILCLTALALSLSYPRWLTAAGGAWVVLTVIGAMLFTVYAFITKVPITAKCRALSPKVVVELIGYAVCTGALLISIAVCSYAVTLHYFVDELPDGRNLVSGVMHIQACIFFVSAAFLIYGVKACLLARQWFASRSKSHLPVGSSLK